MKILGIDLRVIREAQSCDECILSGIRQWCEHWNSVQHVCRLKDTRYDNCRCAQQAGSVANLLGANH